MGFQWDAEDYFFAALGPSIGLIVVVIFVICVCRGKVRPSVGQQPYQQFQDSDIEGDDHQQSGAGYPPPQQPVYSYPLQQHPSTGFPPPQQPVTTAASLSLAAQTNQSAGKIFRICTIMLVKVSLI